MTAERPAAPVLVVEDNAEVRQALVALLEAEGYRVAEAGDVHPCLIVLDLMMPRMSGWDFRAAQSSDRELASIPVVVLSADPLASQASRLGAAAVLPKPADPERFLELIERLCMR